MQERNGGGWTGRKVFFFSVEGQTVLQVVTERAANTKLPGRVALQVRRWSV